MHGWQRELVAEVISKREIEGQIRDAEQRCVDAGKSVRTRGCGIDFLVRSRYSVGTALCPILDADTTMW